MGSGVVRSGISPRREIGPRVLSAHSASLSLPTRLCSTPGNGEETSSFEETSSNLRVGRNG